MGPTCLFIQRKDQHDDSEHDECRDERDAYPEDPPSGLEEELLVPRARILTILWLIRDDDELRVGYQPLDREIVRILVPRAPYKQILDVIVGPP